MNPRETSYFKIGFFVLCALVIFVTALILLGSGTLFHKTLLAETYFNESVQGLTTGSPVKYRGLQIGYVKQINFVNEKYSVPGKINNDTYNHYIYVLAVITSPFLTGSNAINLHQIIDQDVKEGLRFKLALQGVTGNAYLELNFVDPEVNPLLPIAWTPEHFYIPSTTSTLARASDNVSNILDELKAVDLTQLFNDVNDLTNTTNQVMHKIDSLLMRTNQQVTDIANNLHSVSEQAKQYPSSILMGSPPPKLDPRNL
jgi:phospholipid/cholesterol/gamma-HCH transport system substrate-binding protein/paraquat-inducible protein B